MRTQLHHLLEAEAATRPDAPALTFKDTTAHLRRAVARRRRARRRPAPPRPGARRPRRHLPRQAHRDGGRDLRHLAPRAASSSRSTRCCAPARSPTSWPTATSASWSPPPSGFALLREELAEPARRWSTSSSSAPRRPTARLAWDGVAGEPGPLPDHGVIDIDMAAILYTSGSTGKPKGVVLSHRNMLVGGASVSDYLDNTSDDVILAALPLSFDAGFSQLTTAFTVGAHVVLLNYLLPATSSALCAQHGVTGLTCVPPLWIQLAELEWPAEASRRLRYFANTGGRMPRATLDQPARALPGGRAVPDVRADRGVPLHLPRPRRGRPPPRLDRQGDPQRRDPRRARGRLALRPRRGGRAGAPRRARRARLLERPRAHRRALPPRPRPPRRHPDRGARGVLRRHGRATRTASCTSSAARTR